MAYDNFLVDKRIVERNIAKGLVEREAYKSHIESLPDREQNCVRVSVDGEAEDEADDEAEEMDEPGEQGAVASNLSSDEG